MRRTTPPIDRPEPPETCDAVRLRLGSYKMHTSAVEKPSRISISGTRNDMRCARVRIAIPSASSTTVGGIQIAAIMDVRRKMAKKMTSVRRILAMSLYLRKYLRRVMRAAR
jgi:hypothetical protein